MLKKILIVDDEDKIVDLMVRYLTRNQYDVIGAVGGAKAIEILLKDDTISLVISDLKMPDVNGIDVLKECMKRKIKVLILTASINLSKYGEDLKKLNYNLDEVLYKPIDMKILLEAIKSKLSESNS
jgi:two-component system response regulator AtoC